MCNYTILPAGLFCVAVGCGILLEVICYGFRILYIVGEWPVWAGVCGVWRAQICIHGGFESDGNYKIVSVGCGWGGGDG